MPPKREAANTKVESTTKAETNLPMNDQTDPPATTSKNQPLSPKVTKKVAASSEENVTDDEKCKRKNEGNAEKPEKSAPSNVTATNWDMINFTSTNKYALRQEHVLKISCWNIGGLKRWVKKNCLKFIEYEDPDIFCVQETKCSEENLPEEIKSVKGYKQYWCASDREFYAGVGLLTKSEPLKVNFGISIPELDEDGRCITAEYENYYVVCVCVPPAGYKLGTLPKRLEWNTAFKRYIKSLDEKKPVIICGDMNVAHKEIDLARPEINTKNAGFTKEEREGMSDFLEDGYKDTFRELYPDRADAYTFWPYTSNAREKNVGWRLDYFIISEKLLGNVCDSVMRSEVMGSDHCPITLFIKI